MGACGRQLGVLELICPLLIEAVVARGANMGKADWLFAGRHPCGEGFRAVGERGNIAGVELAIEAEAQDSAVLPANHSGAGQASAVQGDRGSRGKWCRACQLGSTRRQVEQLDGVAVTVGLEESRKGNLDPRVGAAIRERIALLGRGSRSRHWPVRGGVITQVLPKSECRWRGAAAFDSAGRQAQLHLPARGAKARRKCSPPAFQTRAGESQ